VGEFGGIDWVVNLNLVSWLVNLGELVVVGG
jgi:hypothetical protein